MIRTYTGRLIKIDKNKFHSEHEYYRFYMKQKYNIEFKKNTEKSLKTKLSLKIKNMQKNYS
jgi:hypothetical protein